MSYLTPHIWNRGGGGGGAGKNKYEITIYWASQLAKKYCSVLLLIFLFLLKFNKRPKNYQSPIAYERTSLIGQFV